MDSVCIITLGCKLNKYESDCMATILENAGFDVFSELKYADIYVLNTCGVTAESEKKSRQYISKFVKLNPKCKIVVCGCASENNINQFLDKPNVFSVFGNEDKYNILDYIKNSHKNITKISSDYNSVSCPKITTTRAYMKVQDGCNNFCSYCLIPYLRGRSRSRSISECVIEANILAKTSKEIVLTGIDMSSFEPSLKELMIALKDVPARIRIGSLEVGVINEDFMSALAGLKNFCPHFHLSLQSGDDNVLKRMNRHYTTDEYFEKVSIIRKYFPLANITTDIIVGFANETEEEYLNTLNFVTKVGFGQVHVFPYSVRQGTVASKIYKDEITNKEKNERVNRLKSVAHVSFQNYINTLKCVTLSVLTEDIEDDYVVGYSENYIKTYLPKNTPLNKIISVEIVETYKDGVLGKVKE